MTESTNLPVKLWTVDSQNSFQETLLPSSFKGEHCASFLQQAKNATKMTVQEEKLKLQIYQQRFCYVHELELTSDCQKKYTVQEIELQIGALQFLTKMAPCVLGC